jgi:SOS-response transcriptional repressor LexA
MMANDRASKRQKELLDFVTAFIHEHGYGPSYREVMRALDYKSVSTVAVHVEGLITKGYLRKTDNSARSLEVVLTDSIEKQPTKNSPDAKEKWLVDEITKRFDTLKSSPVEGMLDDVYVLIGTLHILGFAQAHEAMKEVLANHLKAQRSAEKT